MRRSFRICSGHPFFISAHFAFSVLSNAAECKCCFCFISHLYALFSKPAFVTAALQNLYYHTSVRLYRHIFRLCNIFRFLTPHFKLQFSLCSISPHCLSLLYKLHTIIFLFMLFYTSEKCYFFILMLDYTLFS